METVTEYGTPRITKISLKLTGAKYIDGYSIEFTFSNGINGINDLKMSCGARCLNL